MSERSAITEDREQSATMMPKFMISDMETGAIVVLIVGSLGVS